MKVNGDYAGQGFAQAEGLIPPEVAAAFLRRIRQDLFEGEPGMRRFHTHAPIIRRTSIDVYAADYPPMLQFLWGLTPTLCALTGRDLLPTYNYFRLYRQDDICRVHSDRPACEHSVSLTLGYSDGAPWPFEVGLDELEEAAFIENDFAGAPYARIVMQPGDAVLYRGVTHAHGRMLPNPNRWSAHMFLHWVDRDGPHAGEAFDRRHGIGEAVDFDL